MATPGALLSVVGLTDNNTHSLLEQTLTCGVMALVLVATLVLMLLGNRVRRVIGGRFRCQHPEPRGLGLILSAVAFRDGLQRLQG